MADVSMDLELVKPKRTYRLGDDVAGKVRVGVSRSFSCRKLVLWARYVTEGRGERDSAVECEIELFSGDWFEGEAYEYSFVLPTPNGPFSYKGTYLNINWLLEA